VSTTAHALVLLGTAAAFVTVGQRDRSELGWLALPLLGVAEALLGHEDSPVVEAWLLPALVVLVVGGARRLRGERVAAVSSPLLSGTALGVVAGIGALTDPDVDRLAVATAVLVLVGMVAAWLVTERLDTTLEAPVAALAVAASGVTCVWTWTHAAVAGPTTTTAAYAVLAAALLVAAGPLSRQPASRLVLEASGGLVALATLATAPTGPAQPMVLTIVGSAVAVVSVLHRDRVQAGWLSTVLLGAATYLRVVDDVQAPELYTLPAAALLLAAGAWRLRSDIQVGSLSALGSGLTLALVPSLLLALDEPVSLRGALVGGGAVLALAVGVRHRLVAPFAFGAGSVALLALRHLTPVSDAVPRWVSLAVLGVALLVVGITWEQRLRDLRAARAYIAALR
jgi:surface antigen